MRGALEDVWTAFEAILRDALPALTSEEQKKALLQLAGEDSGHTLTSTADNPPGVTAH